ncbi:MAG: class D sortase [Ruminococcus sp.]|nr:class D sortase [Ruminococcus sp.]
MSGNRNRRKHKNFNGKSFIILPIIFLVGTYLVLYVALAPSLGSVASAAGLFFSDTEKDYSTEYKNIFVPVVEDESEDKEEKPQEVNIDDITYPEYSNLFGELIIENCGIDTNLFFGDGDISLRNGVGIYAGSFIPGYGKTILVAGHNNTYFNGLKNASEGDIVNIRTSYGNYVYEITECKVLKANDKSAVNMGAEEENLVMYTCYPFDELGLTAYRYFVYAKYVSGPSIDKNSLEG